MSNETMITVIGNLASDPEMRYTLSGRAVANFTVATTPRKFDRDSGEWKDGETAWLRCSVWGDYAENVHATLAKGSRVMVYGALGQRHYETTEGEKRSTFEVAVEEVGPVLRYARGELHKVIQDRAAGEDWTPTPKPGGKRAASADPVPATADAPF
jgi:single-strand DNA-binding protein